MNNQTQLFGFLTLWWICDQMPINWNKFAKWNPCKAVRSTIFCLFAPINTNSIICTKISTFFTPISVHIVLIALFLMWLMPILYGMGIILYCHIIQFSQFYSIFMSGTWKTIINYAWNSFIFYFICNHCKKKSFWKSIYGKKINWLSNVPEIISNQLASNYWLDVGK